MSIGNNPFGSPPPIQNARYQPPSVGLNPFANAQPRGVPQLLSGPIVGYNSDVYTPLLSEIDRITSLYSNLLTCITKVVIEDDIQSEQLPKKEEELSLAANIDEYDEQLRFLTQKIATFRASGTRPIFWRGGSVIISSRGVLERCTRLQSGEFFPGNRVGRKPVQWHFRGPVEVLTSLVNELQNCNSQFAGVGGY